MTPPLLFTFGLHLHQPVGNFDSVFEQHLRDVYAPLLDALDRDRTWPVSLHLSGPLLDWLESHAPTYLDRLGRLAADGLIELLLAGYDEPILAVLSRADRLEQIGRMKEALARRFGIEATGLWLTERVWEPDLAEDLARAGVSYVLVDDRHFLVGGFEREQLHRPFRTEAGGHQLDVFPIDERMRYLVPFRSPGEIAEYFRALRAAGAPIAILADDGEKFGGWPGTLEWVYHKGWMGEFTGMLRALEDSGEIRLATFAQALAQVPSGGLAYLPSASYREMEGWALPTAAGHRLTALERSLGTDRLEGADGALVRGTHWRNFLVKYPESNRMHKKMMALSALCRDRGDPVVARRAIGRAQCNDAYWHGVFGGLYLPHLRDGVWRQLALAEEALRAPESLGAETTDIDGDGHSEIWVHSSRFSAIVSPRRGGAIEEWTVFPLQRNLVNVLTRRPEAYHAEAIDRARAAPTGNDHGDGDGTASIHQIEQSLVLDELPPFDRVTRALLQEQLVGSIEDEAALATHRVAAMSDWSAQPFRPDSIAAGDRWLVTLNRPEFRKELSFGTDGSIEVSYLWTARSDAEWFVSTLSLSGEPSLRTDAARRWRYPIETVAKSEKGFDRTIQGTAIVLGWPASAGRGSIVLTP